ncbi:DUF559 domain-containing protein [Cupriavidus taiwanensis]|uniref:DUF559 domain-containing protein n=1 Tax=Cupriavidus taiwanensis TaxID=164546 RepID=UPI000E10DD9B|nr:DUF559 domain-containing protein [Cupriavidus taiwanensis]SPA56680.1 protein of unknown function [Cupriavidus taiwanensis]
MTLLEHFSKPKVAQDVDDQGNLIKLCESGFEREVFTMLVQRDYRVIPQVKSGAYRLDMVVEGANDARLAVECDGDAYHGPDRWQSDMNRQRILERAGWTFWRKWSLSVLGPRHSTIRAGYVSAATLVSSPSASLSCHAQLDRFVRVLLRAAPASADNR